MTDGSFDSMEPEGAEATGGATATTKDPREVSTIGFPYQPLSDAIAVARAIHIKGAVPMARDQLAAAMDQRVGTGNFGNKVGAARMFGLIETIAGKYQLTRLGRDILSPDEAHAKGARVLAFLNIPLYRRVYDEFRNEQLPPRPDGLENALVSFGVAAKQKDKARRAFDSSAHTAGFFEHGSNRRLVEPVVGALADAAETAQAEVITITAQNPDETDGSAKAILLASDHPFVKGLLLSLPKLGDTWDTAARVKWLRMAADAFDMMYKGGNPSILITPADPALLAWTGVVQLLAKADEHAVTPKMLLSTLTEAWQSPQKE